MAGKLVPLVLLPRFSSFVGAPSGFYATDPVEVTAYQGVLITGWRGPMRASAVFSIELQESADQEVWATCDGSNPGGDPGENTEDVFDGALTMRWLRLRVTLGGITNPQVTCWAVGHLEMRD